MLPRIIFDTTGINSLEDSGAASAPLMRGLACGFDVILTATSVGELIATAQAGKKRGAPAPVRLAAAIG